MSISLNLPQTILANLGLTEITPQQSLLDQVVMYAHDNDGSLPLIHLPDRVASKLQHRLSLAWRLRQEKNESASEAVILWLYERCIAKPDIESFLKLPSGSLKRLIYQQTTTKELNPSVI